MLILFLLHPCRPRYSITYNIIYYLYGVFDRNEIVGVRARAVIKNGNSYIISVREKEYNNIMYSGLQDCYVLTLTTIL